MAASRTDDASIMDQSILNTPKPQASSTVNRRPQDPLPPAISKVMTQPQVPSPSYLSNAIDGMRLLTDQLGSLQDLSESGDQCLTSKLLSKAASVSDLCDKRRQSVTADSEANSSLGILKLDDVQGLFENEDPANLTGLSSYFRRDYRPQSLGGKENIQRESLSSKFSSSLMSLNDVELGTRERKVGSEISGKLFNTDMNSSQRDSLSMHADLKLRLQKVLAQRTIDRSLSSIRMSQMSEYDVDSQSITEHEENPRHTVSKDAGKYFSNIEQTPSPASNATFGAANFMSFSDSPVVLDSSENFQSADLAMERLKQDENSWRQHFEDLPTFQDSDKASKPDDGALEHLTQNLDLSAMSGIIAGEVTVSSSIMEDVGKRRLSAGEYFKLRTEQMGGDEERPFFGNLIKSPPKRRPHPPLISLNSTDSASVDEVPTRDSGLNKTLSSSFADSLNFSESVISDILNGNQASKSIDLMPPPPVPPAYRPRPSNAETLPSTRDSLSTRLSMSLSLPRDYEADGTKDLNSSSLSLDSGEKFVSISQMVRIMQDLPSGPKSTRQLVDDFMQKCKIPQSNTPKVTKVESSRSQGSCQGSPNRRSSLKMDSDMDLAMHSISSPSRNQRIKEWVSAISNKSHESLLEEDPNSDAIDKNGKIENNFTYDIKESRMKRVSSASDISKDRHKMSENQLHEQKMRNSSTKQRAPVSDAPQFNEHNDVSVASFMPPPSDKGTSVGAHLRNFSTPKGHLMRSSKSHERLSSNSLTPTSKSNASARRTIDSGSHEKVSDVSSVMISSQGIEQKVGHDKSSDSKHSSQSSINTLKSFRRSGSQKPVSDSKSQSSDWKYQAMGDMRPPSNCSSTRSAVSCTKSTSKQTDSASVSSVPLQIDSTHTQLSWASVALAASVTQTFALRNRCSARVRLLVTSPNAAFKLVGERGEVLSELMLTLQSEETRRIHVVFSPLSLGPVVGKLVICRVATSEGSYSSEDRRLIALYGYGGVADLSVEGASKDRWAQLFLNMCMIDSDVRHEVSDVDVSNDAPQVIAHFSVRNGGKVPAYVSLQIAGELPFDDCGVYVTPKSLSLAPGEDGRVTVRFDPGRDILQWLNKNADDMQLLANIWLSWSELATWQRMRRLFLKYYKGAKSGPLSTWGSLYEGDLGVGYELKDNKSSESALAQAVRRYKVAVLIERERLNLFDMDATLIFDQLVANETAMFNSPQLIEGTLDSSDYFDSPVLAGMSNNIRPLLNGDSPVSTISKKTSSKHEEQDTMSDLIVVTNAVCDKPQVFTLEFPPTVFKHKSKIKVTFQNPSLKRNLVSISDLSPPYSVSTPKFQVPPSSYVTMCVFFRPSESGTHHSTLNVFVDGNHIRSYLLRGEGVQD